MGIGIRYNTGGDTLAIHCTSLYNISINCWLFITMVYVPEAFFLIVGEG